MDKREFIEQLAQDLSVARPDMEFSVQEVEKLQGQSYTGISMGQTDSIISAVLNLEQFFEEYQNGREYSAILNQMSVYCDHAFQQIPKIDTAVLSDYGAMKPQLMVQMIPVAGNEESLLSIPHKNVEDMAVVYRIELESNDQGTSSILINNNMLKFYGITEEQLHSDALEAAMQNHPASLRNMSDVMRDMMDDIASLMIPDDPSPIWVATVEGGLNGACVLQYPEFLDQAAETMGGDFFILPSSVHEVLFLPDDGSMELSHLEQMVREVNETQVAPVDRLSNNVFHYDSEAHIFENAHAFEAREAAKEEIMLADEPAPMQTDTITVLLVEPNKHPKVIEAKTGLEDLQALVGGYIEVTYPYEDNVGLIMNEEGKLDGLPLNRAVRDENGEVQDIIAGSFLVVSLTEDSFGSLTQNQIEKFEEMFHQPEVFVKMGRSIMTIPIPEEKMEAQAIARAKAPEEIEGKPKHKKPDRDDH